VDADSERLLVLVEEGNIDALLHEVSPQDVANTWMRYHRQRRSGVDPDHDPDWWAVETWMTLEWLQNEPRVRDGILRLVSLARDESDFGIIGAAVQETFIHGVWDDDSRVAWIEEQAASSEAFRRSLANVQIWGDVPHDVATRIEAAARTRLPRPLGWHDP
jgi:hypothetical protein